MKKLTPRYPTPSEIEESERLMEYHSKAFENNNLDAFLVLLGNRGNGSGWRATVEFHPDHPPGYGMNDGRSYLKLEKNDDKQAQIAILNDLTFAEVHSRDDVRQITKERAIEIYGNERRLIYAINERFRQAVIWAKYLFPDRNPPEEPSIPEHLTPVGGK